MPGSVLQRPDPVRDAFLSVQRAEQLRLARQFDQAQVLCEGLLREYPDYTAALHTLGLVRLDKGDYQRALDSLVRAAMYDPQNWGTLIALSAVYLKLQAPEMAAQTLERARAINSDDVGVFLTLGEIYTQEREYELGRDIFGKALAREPNLAPAAMGLAEACKYLGEFAEAAKVLQGMIARGQRSLDVLVALAGVPAAVVEADLLSELDRVAGDDEGYDKAEFESFVAYVRATALDRAGRAAEAWQGILSSKRAMFPAVRAELRAVAAREQVSLARLLEHPARSGGEADGMPISLFILGPSRSGKTTMERLVGTLDGVKRGYENPGVDHVVRRAFQAAALLVDRLESLPAQYHPIFAGLYGQEIARL